MTRPAYTANDIALAYELRQEGCEWKRIAQGLGINARALKSAVNRAMYRGIARLPVSG
ncbi:hypothetical protein KLEP174_gp52 [Pseudomonas phage vB_PcuM_ KLEP17-4]|nr:hypothetical protein KLEP174_gp52 [Pseudomonas phage vB_PcuM_ KLEP17-4]